MAKTFDVTKQEVYRAYLQVEANRGAEGIDGVSIAKYGENLAGNLYKLWNRMGSGSYFPSPVRREEIPKADGGLRPLGIPTVEDRIAQTVIKNRLEPLVEPHFHKDSYGYRPGVSAINAVARARQRCWEYDWVLDMDIKSFFDTIDHELLMRAVSKFTECKFTKLYILRWLKAPVVMPCGGQKESVKGTPQGGVVSPLLANIFLHFTFDKWMQKKYPTVPFERYADDIVVHCRSKEQLEELKAAIKERLHICKLELSETKTKAVYCQDSNRKEVHSNRSFDFLGFTFRPRVVRAARSGIVFVGFTPAVSRRAEKSVRTKIKNQPVIKRVTHIEIEDIATVINPIVQGWTNYFKHFCKSALQNVYEYLDRKLEKWARRKYKGMKNSKARAKEWLAALHAQKPNLFVHWRALAAKA